jgi:hypothetical protein
VDVQTDTSGNLYIELDRPRNEKTRLTYIPHQKWADQAVFRIQIRQADGHLRSGPEIVVEQLGDLVSGAIHLFNRQARENR